MERILAIDLGGTNIKIALVDQTGHIWDKNKQSTPENLLAFLKVIQKEAQMYADVITGISISSPGAVTGFGTIHGSSAVPYIHGINLKKRIEQATGLPVQIENDANCAALAEVWRGSARDKKDVAVIVLGTGVGGAIVKDGSIHKGANLHGGEFGYMILNPNNLGSKVNTFSEVASTSSIIRRVARRKHIDEKSLSGEKVFQLAEKGDEICKQAIQEFYRMLAIGVYNIQYTFDPSLILLGGGISNRDYILTGLNRELSAIVNDIAQATIMPMVQRCHFFADANLIGAVYHFLQKTDKHL